MFMKNHLNVHILVIRWIKVCILFYLWPPRNPISKMPLAQQGELYIWETASQVAQKENLKCVAERTFEVQETCSQFQECIWLASSLIFKIRCCAFACYKPNYPWWMLDKFLTRTNNCLDHSLRVCHFHFLPHSNPPLHHVWGCFDKINPQHADELFKFYSVMYENRNAREMRLAPVEKPRSPPTDWTSSQTNYNSYPSNSWASCAHVIQEAAVKRCRWWKLSIYSCSKQHDCHECQHWICNATAINLSFCALVCFFWLSHTYSF